MVSPNAFDVSLISDWSIIFRYLITLLASLLLTRQKDVRCFFNFLTLNHFSVKGTVEPLQGQNYFVFLYYGDYVFVTCKGLIHVFLVIVHYVITHYYFCLTICFFLTLKSFTKFWVKIFFRNIMWCLYSFIIYVLGN